MPRPVSIDGVDSSCFLERLNGMPPTCPVIWSYSGLELLKSTVKVNANFGMIRYLKPMPTK